MLKNLFIVFCTLLFLAGCSIKHQINFSAPYLIVIKTKDIAMADSGFVKKADGYKSIEIFTLGKLTLHVEIGNDACINGYCTDRIDFNRRFFGYQYYANLLDDILDRSYIYAGVGKIETQDGFLQKIKTKNYDIIYRVTDKTTYFKDRKNHILIKLTRLQGET
ncbi:Putative lipoprotein [hydrothermal vent metagenome]|uniref:Putative lipoprotein n=1 Tax=hydrothermal vent metagenome TaxID=652676 RepID=A0A1W1C137_9ZZZZ